MPTLKDLILHKEEIKSFSKKLGFIPSSIRVAKYGIGQLTLVIDEDKNVSGIDLPGPKSMCLQNWLTEKYTALFSIISTIPATRSSVWNSVIDESVNIDNEEGLVKLFGNLEEVKIHEGYPEDQELIPDLKKHFSEEKSSEKKTNNNGHSIFKRKHTESDEFGYSLSPSSTTTTDSDSDPEELITKTILGFKDLPIGTIDKVIGELQKLKQTRLASSDEEPDFKPKKQQINKI